MAEEVEDIVVVLSEPQELIMATRMQTVLDMAGQGGGKSQNIGYDSGLKITMFPRARGFIGANTYDQLSQATLKNCYEVWRALFGLTEYTKDNPYGSYVVDKRPPPHFQQFIKLRSYKNVMSFSNGAMVILGSLDNYEALDGREFAWAHLDETKDTKEEAVKDVITGRLRQRGLWYDEQGELLFNDKVTNAEALAKKLTAWNPLYVHTSPAKGMGAWLNTWFNLDPYRDEIKTEVLKKEFGFYSREDQEQKTLVVIYSAYHNKDNLPPGKLEGQEKRLGPDRALKLVYGYPFSKTGGEYYKEFNRLQHVQPVVFQEGEPLHLTWDFNVIPYMTCLLAQIEFVERYVDAAGRKKDQPLYGDRRIEVMLIKVYKEYCFEPPRNTTAAICNQIIADFKPVDSYYYGDAQGLNRIEGLGYTRFSTITEPLWQFFHNQSKRVKSPNVDPIKRGDLLNDIFAGRIPEVEVIIDPSCERTIDDMEQCKEGVNGKVKTRIKDENTGGSYEPYGHTSDALEYLVSYVAKHYIK